MLREVAVDLRDDKDDVAAGLMLMLLVKRLNVPLDRDLIFLAEAGEEGTSQVGIDYMIDKHWDAIEAEFALAEGGYVAARNGKVRFVEVSTTEKVPRGVRLVAHGTAGHGSRPRPDNAIVRLGAAVAKLGSWQPPIRLNDTTRAYFERLAAISPPEEAWRYRHILDRDKAQRSRAATAVCSHASFSAWCPLCSPACAAPGSRAAGSRAARSRHR